MLQILSWLLVYTLIQVALGWAVRPLRDRSWFKVLCLPGTLLAASIQSASAFLSVATNFRFSPFRDGEPAFELERDRVPCLSGALFVLLTHAALYVLYLILAAELESAALLDIHSVRLPGLSLPEARLEAGFAEYLRGLWTWIQGPARQAPAACIVFYFSAASFASLRVSRRETFWALVMFCLVGGATYLGNWFGVDFPFLSRGWWARRYYFSDWWAVFSLYLTLAWLSLCAFLVFRVLLLVPRLFGVAARPADVARKRAAKRRAKIKAGRRRLRSPDNEGTHPARGAP